MKVLSLQCADQHLFEGWFASEEDYQSQSASGLLQCPLCGNGQIVKLPSVPRLNLKSTSSSTSSHTCSSAGLDSNAASGKLQQGAEPSADAASSAAEARATSATPEHPALQLQAAYLQAVRHVLAHTEDVGPRLAQEARRMHYGEMDSRPIRGQASGQEVAELQDEGIDLWALPMPDALKETLQ